MANNTASSPADPDAVEDTTNPTTTVPPAMTLDEKERISKMLPIRMISKVVHGFGRGSSELGIPTANLDVVGGRARSASATGAVAATVDNNDKDNDTTSLQELPTGIYWGFCRVFDPVDPEANTNGNKDDDDKDSNDTNVVNSHVVYTTAVSIGYNPTYGNKEKTVEPHLIAPTQDDPRRHASSCGETVLPDFYDRSMRLSLVGYLRPELPFEGLEKLIVAIKKDIEQAEKLGACALDEKETREHPAECCEQKWVSGQEEL